MKDVLVSVLCLTYNHEKYIESALEGFVNQKTDFNFEVLVHDDASVDNTQLIVSQYAKKYPEIIKPIFQKENQYSKGISISEEVLSKYARGKYIAICEGDDYWSDCFKLQSQIDYLEAHPEYSACVHNSYGEDVKTDKKKIIYKMRDKDLTFKDVIEEGGQSFQSSSLIYRKQFLSNRPDFFRVMNSIGVEDYPLAIYLAFSGKIKYFGKPMSVYRMMTENSWTKNNSNDDKLIIIYRAIIVMLNSVNTYTQGKYQDTISTIILRNEYKICLTSKNYKMLRNRKFAGIWKNTPWIARIKRILYSYFGSILCRIRQKK